MGRPRFDAFPPYPKKPHSSGQARIRLGDRHVYLGTHGSDASWAKYRRRLAEWQESRASGSPAPQLDRTTSVRVVANLVALYWQHVQATYKQPDGKPGTEVRDFKLSARSLLELYGKTPIADFGPLALKAVRQHMIDVGGLCRKTVNQRVQRLKRMFRWGVSEELIDVRVRQRIDSVEGLRARRTNAVDHPEVEPADPDDVDAVLTKLGPVVAAMVQVQRLTGMRPGEVCGLTPGEIDRTGSNGRGKLKIHGSDAPIWVYRPAEHKTAWRGHRKAVAFGPRAQAVLAPFLDGRALDKPCFSPAEEVVAVLAARRAKAKAPRRVTRGRVRPGRTPGECYNVAAYGRRIARACVLADVPVWSPHQLRHLAEVEIERAFDLDAARAVLGHRDPRITLRYGKQDLEKAAKVAAAMG